MNAVMRSLSLLMVLLAGLVIAGSAGTWVDAGLLSISGLEGDGLITFAIGMLVLVFGAIGLIRPGVWPLGACTLGFGAAAAVGVYDWREVQDGTSETFGAVGWGLVLMTAAAVAALAVLAVAWLGVAAWATIDSVRSRSASAAPPVRSGYRRRRQRRDL